MVNINNFVFRGLGSMDNYIEYGVLTPDHTSLPKVRGSGILERVGWLAK